MQKRKRKTEVDEPKVFSWFLFCFSKGWVCHVGVVDAKLMLLFLG
jgi:hypothetical protein